MSKKESYEQRTEELILPILEENQFELVDVEYVKEGMKTPAKILIIEIC